MRFRLTVERGEGAPTRYRGTLTIEGAATLGIEVVIEGVADAPRTPLGATASLEGEGLSGELRADLERLAARLVASAVSRARAVGQPPPRRISRWRER